MATLNTDILDAAFADGLIPKKISSQQRLYLHSSVIMVNLVYKLIAEQTDGLDSEQLTKRLKIHSNTLFHYTRWLEDKKLILNEGRGNKKNLYFVSH